MDPFKGTWALRKIKNRPEPIRSLRSGRDAHHPDPTVSETLNLVL